MLSLTPDKYQVRILKLVTTNANYVLSNVIYVTDHTVIDRYITLSNKVSSNRLKIHIL